VQESIFDITQIPQDCLGSQDGGKLVEHLAAEDLAFDGEPPWPVIVEEYALPAVVQCPAHLMRGGDFPRRPSRARARLFLKVVPLRESLRDHSTSTVRCAN